jgi:outer membrane lipoprotein SlyB
MRPVLYALGMALALAGCAPGHTSSPSQANQPYPVTFYLGHVVSVQNALIGYPAAGVGITGGLVPGIVAGIGGGSGVQPLSGYVGPVVGGIGVGPGIGAPAQALEYTVALDGSTQVVQISQYILAEDYAGGCPGQAVGVICPGQPVVIRVVNNMARVVPRSALPPPFDRLASAGPMGLPLDGRPPVLASPPTGWYGVAAAGTYYPIFSVP